MKKYYILLSALLCFACESFVEVMPPSNMLEKEAVFESEANIISAIEALYGEMTNAYFSSGSSYSITMVCGIASDELGDFSTNNVFNKQLDEGNVSIENTSVLNLWESAYHVIYMANAFLQGIATVEPNIIDPEVKTQLIGEAKTIRAFTYLYLTQLFGEVPLTLITDYRVNGTMERSSVQAIFQQIRTDLEEAISELDDEYRTANRTTVTKVVAQMLLARVALYQQNWEEAASLASAIVERTDSYEVLGDLNSVYLANSREAIFQIDPRNRGYTYEGRAFILQRAPTSVALEQTFPENFELNDRRLSSWIGTLVQEEDTYYFPYKYKVASGSGQATEYSMVMRFAEAYLIGAEARAHLGELSKAIADLDVIRGRAGISLLAATNPSITQPDLLSAIAKERQRELFTEWGHRWFDMVRTETASDILAHTGWGDRNFLLPIPELERQKNPNLTQNNGY